MVVDTSYGQAIVLDMSGTVQVPNSPFAVIESEMNKVQKGHAWPNVEAMMSSIRRNAPEAKGLPKDAPNPNQIYNRDGQYIRYVIDSSEIREHYVENGVVMERVALAIRNVSLSLEGARRASGTLKSDGTTTHCDYWNGFTWLRNGYTPERDFPVMVQQASRSVDGTRLVFSQPVSPTDEARIRHEVSHMDRTRPTLPVETADTIAGETVAAASVPFPEADSVTYDAVAPTEDFNPNVTPPIRLPADDGDLPSFDREDDDEDKSKRRPGRPRKET